MIVIAPNTRIQISWSTIVTIEPSPWHTTVIVKTQI